MANGDLSDQIARIEADIEQLAESITTYNRSHHPLGRELSASTTYEQISICL